MSYVDEVIAKVVEQNPSEPEFACFGLSIKIKKLPTAHPMKAPKTGINAVNAIKIPIRSAYGIRKILSVMTNIHPRITASRH